MTGTLRLTVPSAAALFLACSTASGPAVSSRSYRGHESDADVTHFVNAYPAAVGTRLDDCQTCHRGATLHYADTGRPVQKNPCDFCHLLQHPDEELTGGPASIRDTLNPYGLAYVTAGRSRAALQSIDGADSDGDGAANGAEIRDLKYPGDAASRPGQAAAPSRAFGWDELHRLAVHGEFLLANANRQQTDFYATYTGVKLRDLLIAAGVNPDSPEVQGVTVVAPDGYVKDVPMSAINQARPAGTFRGGLDTGTLGSACGFVQYPSPLPAGVRDGQPIPGEPWVILAWERDGRPLDPASLDPVSGRIDGEGPYRLVVPQARPGAPDRGSQYSPTRCDDGFDYDESKDHNAGDMVRGVVAIRVNPLPAGTEDLDYHNGGWAFVAGRTVVVYGAGVRPR